MLLTEPQAASSLLDMTINDEHSAALREAAERVESTKAEFDAAKAERERVIQQVALEGASYREIAAEAGMSYQRVHQLLTGEKEPPKMPYGIDTAFHCPKCEAKPRQKCKDEKGKDRQASHIQRSHRAHAVYFDGDEPRADEPGPHTAIFSALEGIDIGGHGVMVKFQARGPVYINPDDAAAHARTFDCASAVGRWAGNKWEQIDV